jgi:hypothetical protein
MGECVEIQAWARAKKDVLELELTDHVAKCPCHVVHPWWLVVESTNSLKN